MPSYKLKYSDYKDKSSSQPFYIYNGIPYEWKGGLNIERMPRTFENSKMSDTSKLAIWCHLKRTNLNSSGFYTSWNLKSKMLLGTGLILGLRKANERRRYKVTPSLIGWAQT